MVFVDLLFVTPRHAIAIKGTVQNTRLSQFAKNAEKKIIGFFLLFTYLLFFKKVIYYFSKVIVLNDKTVKNIYKYSKVSVHTEFQPRKFYSWKCTIL